jgi:hypothetical protein
MAGYRLDGTNGTSRADWDKLRTTAAIASPTIIPLVAAALGMIGWRPRGPRARRHSRISVLVPAWIVFATCVFYAGGLFHRHYWIGLTFPLALAAGIGVSRISSRRLANSVTALIAVPTVICTLQLVVMNRAGATMVASGDPRSTTNVAVAKWWQDHRQPGDSIYVLCASAAFYADADVVPPYPYLWQDGVIHGRRAQERLVAMFAGNDAPTYVVMYQPIATCNPNGRVAPLLRDRYEHVGVVDGREILRLTSSSPRPAIGGYG